MGGDDTAVRMGNQHDFLPAVGFENAEDFVADFLFRESGVRDSETYGHDFDGYDADVAIALCIVVSESLVELS